jgi:hypothetical protein
MASQQKNGRILRNLGIVRAGRLNSGTYAHKDIAFEFGSWLNPEIKLYLVKEFQRLKDEESNSKRLEWDFQRTLSKINYRIHTDAIKENLIPSVVTKEQFAAIYANEADLLNVATSDLPFLQLYGDNIKNNCVETMNLSRNLGYF